MSFAAFAVDKREEKRDPQFSI